MHVFVLSSTDCSLVFWNAVEECLQRLLIFVYYADWECLCIFTSRNFCLSLLDDASNSWLHYWYRYLEIVQFCDQGIIPNKEVKVNIAYAFTSPIKCLPLAYFYISFSLLCTSSDIFCLIVVCFICLLHKPKCLLVSSLSMASVISPSSVAKYTNAQLLYSLFNHPNQHLNVTCRWHNHFQNSHCCRSIVRQVWQGGSSLNLNFVVGGGDDDDDDNNDGSDDNGSTTPWSRVLQKQIGHHLVKKFLKFCGTQLFFTEFISALHLSVSWARSILSIPPLEDAL